MPSLDRSIDISVGTVRVVSSARSDGDFAQDRPELRRSISPWPWTWLRQVHGADAVVVRAPGEHAGATADAAVTGVAHAPIAVRTADCAPVVLVGSCAVAVVHAGWRRIQAGVIKSAAEALDALGAQPVESVLGPCIFPANYAFGPADLEPLVAALGPSIVGTTSTGDTALDMPAAVARACEQSGWPAPQPFACTSNPEYFSHRTRQDAGRLTTVAWIETGHNEGHGQ